MKKTIFICGACFSIIMVNAQDQRNIHAPAAPPIAMVAPEPPQPPLPPPAPPPPPMVMEDALLPIPPAPPLPPVPPSLVDENEYSTGVIINDNGNEMEVRKIKGRKMILIQQGGKTIRIKLSTWNANRKYYEKKFGELPPILQPDVEEVKFIPPVMTKDKE